MSPDGHRLVAMNHEQLLHIYNFVTRELEYEIDLKSKLASVAISQDSKYLLINKTDGEARMFDLDSREFVRVFNTGDLSNEFIIRCTFGGANESFVVTGSKGMFTELKNDVRLTHTLA
jgi:WD40 repeat protein